MLGQIGINYILLILFNYSEFLSELYLLSLQHEEIRAMANHNNIRENYYFVIVKTGLQNGKRVDKNNGLKIRIKYVVI